MGVLAVVLGTLLVVTSFADMLNTLVATHTSRRKFWFTYQLYLRTWHLTRIAVLRLRNERLQHAILSGYAPVSVLLLLLGWLAQQIVGFGLLWWGIGGVQGAHSLWDSLYFSGVVYFTVGFGEMVPVDAVPRVGALVEALLGVLTIALVIGYLPSLYAAYAERERKLTTLDDGSEDRITPTNLVCARAPDADPRELDDWFVSWEDWIAGIMETHTTYPMLVFLRSKQPGQSWVTALGLMCDAALHCEMMPDARGRAPYWMLRRAIRLMDELTAGVDLTRYRNALDGTGVPPPPPGSQAEERDMFRELYEQLEAHGFELLPVDEARAATADLRRRYDAKLEWLIDELVAPRGFWGHAIEHRYARGWVISRDRR